MCFDSIASFLLLHLPASLFHLQRVIWDQCEQEFSYQVNEYLYHRGGSRTAAGAGENNHTEQIEKRSVWTATPSLLSVYTKIACGRCGINGLRRLSLDLWHFMSLEEKWKCLVIKQPQSRYSHCHIAVAVAANSQTGRSYRLVLW